MEKIGAVAVTAIVRDDLSQEDFDVEFDAMVQKWAAERWAAEHGEYDEAQDCLDALLEARAIKASAEAREQQCLARLEAIALASANHSNSAQSNSAQPDAGSSAREIAWRSMAAEIAVATRQADRTVQSMMGQATALVHDLPAVLEALGCGRIAFGHARVILEHAIGIESDALEEYQRITLDRAETTTPGKLAATAKIAADRLRAESFEERHARAREARSVSIRDLDNGMSELLHLLPTPFAAAIFDRLTRQAKAVCGYRRSAHARPTPLRPCDRPPAHWRTLQRRGCSAHCGRRHPSRSIDRDSRTHPARPGQRASDTRRSRPHRSRHGLPARGDDDRTGSSAYSSGHRNGHRRRHLPPDREPAALPGGARPPLPVSNAATATPDGAISTTPSPGKRAARPRRTTLPTCVGAITRSNITAAGKSGKSRPACSNGQAPWVRSSRPMPLWRPLPRDRDSSTNHPFERCTSPWCGALKVVGSP